MNDASARILAINYEYLNWNVYDYCLNCVSELVLFQIKMNLGSTLVETVSIDYEDFNESFLTCSTCLCKYRSLYYYVNQLLF